MEVVDGLEELSENRLDVPHLKLLSCFAFMVDVLVEI